jgi:hypothetical protein
MIFVGRQLYGASGAELEKIGPDAEKMCYRTALQTRKARHFHSEPLPSEPEA